MQIPQTYVEGRIDVAEKGPGITQAVILAGGLGTRLRPITYTVPKPMVAVAGRPFLEHLIAKLKNDGFDDILLLVGYQHEKIADHFKDGSTLGVRIRYSVESTPIGTGGALRLAREMLSPTFLMANGDTYLPIPLTSLREAFKKRMMLGIILVYPNQDRVFDNNICVKNDMILKYEKRSKASDLNAVDSGFSIFKKKVIDLIPIV
jgi:NDP-sugar pyrophosphorylase family protein